MTAAEDRCGVCGWDDPCRCGQEEETMGTDEERARAWLARLHVDDDGVPMWRPGGGDVADLTALLRAVRAEEREACAALADMAESDARYPTGVRALAAVLARTIRARGGR